MNKYVWLVPAYISCIFNQASRFSHNSPSCTLSPCFLYLKTEIFLRLFQMTFLHSYFDRTDYLEKLFETNLDHHDYQLLEKMVSESLALNFLVICKLLFLQILTSHRR